MAALVRLPANTLRERLARLAEKGLADSRPHRLQLLGPRPQRRFFPTREGIVALASGERAGTQRLMRLYPESRQWFRVLGDRLDAVAALYRVASIIATLDASDAPVVVTHCRTGPFDLLLRLPSGGTVGLVRQGPMLTNASLRYRIRTIERIDAGERPLLTLILTDSEQDMRRVLRAIADPSTRTETLVAVTGDIHVAVNIALQPSDRALVDDHPGRLFEAADSIHIHQRQDRVPHYSWLEVAPSVECLAHSPEEQSQGR
ncbi:MAG: hypothetical protein OXS30_07630 [Chloroflexota bacterium]|nr:hypothetical protein [Chloroflexota bacterium]